MIDKEEYAEAATEVIDVIQHMDDDLIEKIPINVIRKLNQIKSKTYVPNLDYDKDMKDMGLQDRSKLILTSIYMEYICTEEEKKEIDELIKQSQKAIEEKKQNKYDIDRFFERNKTENVQSKQTNLEEETRKVKDSFELVIVKPKKNFFQKLLDWFRRK